MQQMIFLQWRIEDWLIVSCIACCRALFWQWWPCADLQWADRFRHSVQCSWFISRGSPLNHTVCVHSGEQLMPEHSAFTITGWRRVTHRTVAHCLKWNPDETLKEHRYCQCRRHHTGDEWLAQCLARWHCVNYVNIGWITGSAELYSVYVSLFT